MKSSVFTIVNYIYMITITNVTKKEIIIYITSVNIYIFDILCQVI
jgi:hypothetical protein